MLAAEQKLDPAEATRLAAVTICSLKPEWPMHEALKLIWRYRD